MRKLVVLYLFVLFSYLPCNGNPIPFSPIVKNFSAMDYHAGSQNWAITQDERGVMYFGNNTGLLEYDGSRWTLYPIQAGAVVRAVYASPDGRIYVGSFEEFGYFERNKENRLVFHSLKQQVKNFDFHNDEIWTIVESDGKIIFQSFGSFFIYNGETTAGYRSKELPLNLFQMGNQLYSQQINGGLLAFTGKGFRPFLSREQLGGGEVTALVPYPGGMLLLTRNHGGFIYDGSKVTPWQTPYDSELKHHSINRGMMTKDSCYVIGTLSNGVYAFNRKGELLWKVNADNQLENNTVLGLYCDLNNNVWVALDYGVAYIRSNSLVYYFEPVHRKMGMVYDVLVRKDDAYIASNQGLYRLEDGQLSILPGLEEQAWTVGQWGDQVICGHNRGTFQISGMQSQLMSDIKGAMCLKELQIENHSLLLQGTYTYLNVYKNKPGVGWFFSNSIDNFSHMAKNIEMDHRGNIWVEHMRKGLYKVRLDPQLKEVIDLKKYTSLNHRSDTPCYLFKINGRIVFSDGEKFYTYDDIADSIIPYELMNDQLGSLRGIHTVNYMSDDQYWFLSDREAYLVHCTLTNFEIRTRLSFATFNNLPIEGRARMVYDKLRNCSYLCLNNSLARIKNDTTERYRSPATTSLWVSQLYAADPLSGEVKNYPIIPNNRIEANYNDITIALTYPVYNGNTYGVRYKLEGLSNKWIEGLPTMKKEYAGLSFGDYRFKAEVYNEHGVLSSVELPFSVLRPWYLSYVAIISYVVVLLVSLFILLYLVYAYTKRKKDKVIERQRANHQAEIERQEKKIIELEKEQLEVELRFKSKEVSGVVMTNIAHQEFLASLKEEIQQQKLQGQYSRKNLDKLLAMLNQNLVSNEESWAMFQTNFDRIHENFFRNLKEQFPELTSGDLRLCALLRLNLPTKEIAKLMNISIRGVDAARYRLRKKLNLSQESSLTDFMISFK
ncbi:MAG: hypothetical protein RSB62_05925 [Bacteroides sp.]